MSTSVTNPSQRFRRNLITYLALTVFLFLFSRIYESLSYGEVSFFMHYIWTVPLAGGSLLLTLMKFRPKLSRLSYNLWNSGIATLTASFLLRGIINLSGRSTTLDQPYWLIGASFLALALLSLFIHSKKHA
ncbi:hypothetical protein JEQ21_07325 [Streptococcus sp. 121]|uniref:hypothetical protein n=1 Tax=Streptococcus sp. 121 TaxID=2797637 RepID=UPI0018F07BC7|nr:hypothetical protein [Streptococcus sp. 121]MBJ6746264.1 hypothetical protein [Streptococcus sp. 121]